MRRLLLLIVVPLTLGVTGTAPAPAAGPCTDNRDEAFRLTIPVDGQPAHGFYALPPAEPKGIVVISHGYGHSSYSWIDRLRTTAADLGVVTVAMDGRALTFLPEEKSPGIPNTRGWPVSSAAADGLAAAKHFAARCPGASMIVNFGVSMGGNSSGLMAASPEARLADGSRLFDYWFDIEGATNMTETYLAARMLAPVNGTAARALEDIEAETGGPIEDVPEAYAARSVVHPDNVAAMAANDLGGVVLVHGFDDGLVPNNQSQEMFAALQGHGIPAQFFAVASKDAESERETTITGTVAGYVDPTYRSPLAGHASERSRTHIVMKTAFQRLYALFLHGDEPSCTRYRVVDGGLDMSAYLATTGCDAPLPS